MTTQHVLEKTSAGPADAIMPPSDEAETGHGSSCFTRNSLGKPCWLQWAAPWQPHLFSLHVPHASSECHAELLMTNKSCSILSA